MKWKWQISSLTATGEKINLNRKIIIYQSRRIVAQQREKHVQINVNTQGLLWSSRAAFFFLQKQPWIRIYMHHVINKRLHAVQCNGNRYLFNRWSYGVRLLQQPGFNSTLRLFTVRIVSVQLSCLLSTVLTLKKWLQAWKIHLKWYLQPNWV